MAATQSANPPPEDRTAGNGDADRHVIPGDAGPALSAAEILGADDLPIQRVKVPEWKGHVYVRSMSAAGRDQWELFLISHKTPDGDLNFRNVRATLVAQTCCDAEGQLLFTPDQADALGQKSGRAIDRVYQAAQALNAISDADVEELAKNLPGDGSGSSPSVSASGSE